MPKFFAKRKAEEVKKFLENHDYKLINYNGDDEIWARDDCQYTIKVPSRNEEIPRGTLDQIKKMLNLCGFDRIRVIKWWKDNGYGE